MSELDVIGLGLRRAVKSVTTWASIECEKQRSGERSVSWMVEGWAHAWTLASLPEDPGPTVQSIQLVGAIVEPRHNTADNWRGTNVRVGDSIKPPHQDVPSMMDLLIADWPHTSSDDWYFRFEEIHPFRDGNGRTGNILWNWHRGSLTPHTLEFPPDFWGSPRLQYPPRPA
jgi:hypothetical protein